MKTDYEILQILESHFIKEGWPDGLKSEKYWDRSSVKPDENDMDAKIVVIERHRSMPGAQYTQGSAMSAYQTYWMQFKIEPSNGQCFQMEDLPGGFKIDIDGYAEESVDIESIDLSIEPLEDNRYKVYDSVSNNTANILSFDELQDFTVKLGEGFIDFFKMVISDTEYFDKTQIDQYVDKYKLVLEEKLREKASDLWLIRDEDK